MTRPRGWLPLLARAAFIAVLIGAAFSVRVVLEGQSEMAASDAAFNQGDLNAALDHARRSATLFAPGAPHVEHAYARLQAIALGAEAAGKPKTAFLAWQAVRSAALESRHIFVSRSSELGRANENLARLEAWSRDADAAERSQNQHRALTRLAADEAPSPVWIAVLGTGFLLSLAGLALCAFQGLDQAGKLLPVRARLGLLLFVIGAACWTLAAYRA